MNKLSSQDRSALIRLASSLPAGDETRKAILAGLKVATPIWDAIPAIGRAPLSGGPRIIQVLSDKAKPGDKATLRNDMGDEYDVVLGAEVKTGPQGERNFLVKLASSLPAGNETRKAILAGLSQTAALKPADLEALKKVEAEEGMDPKAIGLSVSKIVALEKLGLVHYDRGDGTVLVTTEGEKHLKGKTAATKAVEPYQKVEGLPYGRGQKKNLFPKVTNERQLRELSKLLDKGFEAFEGGKSITKANQALADKLSALGVDTKSLWGGYDLWVTDAEGVEYDAHNDLGIG